MGQSKLQGQAGPAYHPLSGHGKAVEVLILLERSEEPGPTAQSTTPGLPGEKAVSSAMVLRLEHASEEPGRLVSTLIQGPAPLSF